MYITEYSFIYNIEFVFQECCITWYNFIYWSNCLHISCCYVDHTKQTYNYSHNILRLFDVSRGGFRGRRRGMRATLFLQSLVFFCNHFKELQTVLFEVELIINNTQLTYVYPNTIETWLTPNHLLFGRQLLYSSNTASTVVRNLAVLSSTTDKKTASVIIFFDRWRHEFTWDTTNIKIKYRLPKN